METSLQSQQQQQQHRCGSAAGTFQAWVRWNSQASSAVGPKLSGWWNVLSRPTTYALELSL